MSVLRFALPMPPRLLSPNVGAHHMTKHKAKVRYLAACKLELLVVRSEARRAGVELPLPPVVEGRLTFVVRNMANDPDNLLASFKAGIDAMKRGGLIVEDNARVWRLAAQTVEQAPKGAAELVRVELTGGLA